MQKTPCCVVAWRPRPRRLTRRRERPMLRGGEGGSISVVRLVSSTRRRQDLVCVRSPLSSSVASTPSPHHPLPSSTPPWIFGGGGATGRHGGGEGSSGNREDVFELRLGLQRCEQDRGVCDCRADLQEAILLELLCSDERAICFQLDV